MNVPLFLDSEARSVSPPCAQAGGSQLFPTTFAFRTFSPVESSITSLGVGAGVLGPYLAKRSSLWENKFRMKFGF